MRPLVRRQRGQKGWKDLALPFLYMKLIFIFVKNLYIMRQLFTIKAGGDKYTRTTFVGLVLLIKQLIEVNATISIKIDKEKKTPNK